MGVAALHEATQTLGDEAYVAAVVAVICTTEEGAVDAVHEVKVLCDDDLGDPKRTPGRSAIRPQPTRSRPRRGHPVLAA